MKAQRLIAKWLFKKPIRQYVKENIQDKDQDVKDYLYDLLCKDQLRMVGSKEALLGYYDQDIEINAQLKKELYESN